MINDMASKLREDFVLLHFGEEILRLVKLLNKTGMIDEFTLAEKFEANVNHTRSLLYSLYEQKIVSYSRERDKERMWWIYSWVLDTARIDELILKDINREMQKLGNKKKKLGGNQFFICRGCNEKYSFERAFELNFFCSSCGDSLNAVDIHPILQEIDERIDLLNKRIEILNEVARQNQAIKEEKEEKEAAKLARKKERQRKKKVAERKKQAAEKRKATAKKKPASKRKKSQTKRKATAKKKPVAKKKAPAKKGKSASKKRTAVKKKSKLAKKKPKKK